MIQSRLPGIYFEADPGQLEESLPRMDIAGFVGFAACGPLNTPVPVEDPARFRELFGDDLPLAWDPANHEWESSWLGGAVEAFFANGGRRCWVVRVADEQSARTRAFALDALYRAGALTEELRISARAPGSWADDLRVQTLLTRERLIALDSGQGFFSTHGASNRRSVDISSSTVALQRGDLIEVLFPDTPYLLLMFVDRLTSLAQGIRIEASQTYSFRAVFPDPQEASATNPDLARVLLLRPAAANASFAHLEVRNDPQESLPALLATSPAIVPIFNRLSFELRVRAGDRRLWRLTNLTFHRDHPRFFGSLPDDQELFRMPWGRALPQRTPEQELLRSQASNPRFPLGGLVETHPDAEHFLPLGMAQSPEIERALPAEDLDQAADGLESFRAEFFYDLRLARFGASSLRGEAEHRMFLEQQPLKGMHSLFAIDEITLISVPDAVHRAWDRQAPQFNRLLLAPRLEVFDDTPDELGRYRVAWSRVEQATAYRLEHDENPDFQSPALLYTETSTEARLVFPEPCPRTVYVRVRALRHDEFSAWSETRARVLPHAEFANCDAHPIIDLQLNLAALPDAQFRLEWNFDSSSQSAGLLQFELQRSQDQNFSFPELAFLGTDTRLTADTPRNVALYFRVRVLQGANQGPWSNTVVVLPGQLSLNTLVPVDAFDDRALLAIQRSLIRMCAARADLIAVLSLPRHFQRQETLDHLESLSPEDAPSASGLAAQFAGVAALTRGESSALGYVAVYHPWIARENAQDRLAFAAFGPPDGAVLGSFARLANEGGAWLAPANRPLSRVIALEPGLQPSDAHALRGAGVNVIDPHPRGFFALDAQTLSLNREFTLISVRRLLILLQRLALREGTGYVFEPNNVRFRNLVRQRFERWLGNLFVRGAFAGSRPDFAFRVITDESVNTRQSLDAGRFFVELRVAPSKPLSFLTIRLVQNGPQSLRIQES